MTTLDAMHIALTKGRSQKELTSYYTKNADLLLKYYGSPRPETDFFRISKPSQDLYHEFRARNDPSFAPPQSPAPDRCKNCNAMCDEPTYGSCGCEHRSLQIERTQSKEPNPNPSRTIFITDPPISTMCFKSLTSSCPQPA